MKDELNSEIIKSLTMHKQLIEDYTLPCFCIITTLVKNLPEGEQKNLLAKLQSVAEDIEPLAQAENIESSYAKAAKIVSQIVSGGDDGIASVQRLQLIPGGKNSP